VGGDAIAGGGGRGASLVEGDGARLTADGRGWTGAPTTLLVGAASSRAAGGGGKARAGASLSLLGAGPADAAAGGAALAAAAATSGRGAGRVAITTTPSKRTTPSTAAEAIGTTYPASGRVLRGLPSAVRACASSTSFDEEAGTFGTEIFGELTVAT
jgi:hypothetical protein